MFQRLSLFFLISISFTAAAQQAKPWPAFTQRKVDPTLYPASPVPDRIILSVAADPATSIGVSWRTDTSITSGYAEIKKAAGQPEAQDAQRISSTVTPLLLDDSKANYHELSFTNLQPGTLYMYRVGDTAYRSEWIQFRTASSSFKPFTFLYFGDAQNDHKEWWSRVIRAAGQHQPDAAFMLHAGDLINRTNVDKEWGEWFYAGSWLHSMIPALPTAGNHEFYRDANRTLTLTKHWRPIFNLPLNGPAGLEELAYFIDYQQVRIISISSQSLLLNPADSASQVQWLEKVLQNNPQKWTILTMHHPMFSSGNGRDNKSLRDALQPLFEKYSVDLVLTGHDHTYGRGISENSPHKKKTPLKGPVYVVSVSGPKMYMPSLAPWLQRAAVNTQLYQRVLVEEKKIRMESYTAAGELYDAFDIVKKGSGKKELIDWAPGLTKEHLDLPASYRNKYTEKEKAEYEQKKKEYLERNQ
jgi:acid phosphatase type 7